MGGYIICTMKGVFKSIVQAEFLEQNFATEEVKNKHKITIV